MDEEVMGARQAAEYIGVTRARINQLVGEKKLDRVEVGGYFMYRRSDLDRYKAEPKNPGGRPKSVVTLTQINQRPELVPA